LEQSPFVTLGVELYGGEAQVDRVRGPIPRADRMPQVHSTDQPPCLLCPLSPDDSDAPPEPTVGCSTRVRYATSGKRREPPASARLLKTSRLGARLEGARVRSKGCGVVDGLHLADGSWQLTGMGLFKLTSWRLPTCPPVRPFGHLLSDAVAVIVLLAVTVPTGALAEGVAAGAASSSCGYWAEVAEPREPAGTSTDASPLMAFSNGSLGPPFRRRDWSGLSRDARNR
jgi:hypothetical protein